jgi:hypothetical protein
MPAALVMEWEVVVAENEEMQEITVDASQRPVLKKPPSAWKVGLLFSLIGGPVSGVAAGMIQRHRNKSFLQEEANARAEKDQLYEFMDDEAAIADDAERRVINYARGVVTDGYERLATGDRSGASLIEKGRLLLENIMGGDVVAKKQEDAKRWDFQRDMVGNAAKGYQKEFQETNAAREAMNRQSQMILDLVSDPTFDPNKPINKAHLAQLLDMGGLMFKDSPDLMDGLTEGVGALNSVAGGIVGGLATMLKSQDFKVSAEDYNRLALNSQKYADMYTVQKNERLGSQARELDTWGKKLGVIPEDYSLGEYISGGEEKLRTLPNPFFNGGYKPPPESAAPTAKLGTKGVGLSPFEQVMINTWRERQKARPTN